MTSTPAKRDRTGKEIGLLEWGRLRSDPDYSTVAKDVVDTVTVHTIWEGLDEPPGLPGEMFCTGIAQDGGRTVTIIASHTENDARARHQLIMELARNDSGDPGMADRIRAAMANLDSTAPGR